MANSSIHPQIKCTVHGTDMLRKENHKTGGIFYGCCLFESEGCQVSWSDRDQRYFKDPTVVARASTRRGRGISKREETITRAVGVKLGSREEVERLVETEGIKSLMELIEASGLFTTDHAAE